MMISELVALLEVIKQREGDIKVLCLTLSHSFPPDMKVVDAFGVEGDLIRVLLLNA